MSNLSCESLPRRVYVLFPLLNHKPASVAQLDARPTGGRQSDHEIFSTVILSPPLTQKGQLSVSGEKMCTIPVNHLED